jgi:hypothetical protein
MTCLAPPGYYCSMLDGAVLLCQANRYCPGGVHLPRACPVHYWSPVGTMALEGCQENTDTVFAVTVSLIVVFLAVFVGIWLCCAALVPYPLPECRAPCETRPLINQWDPYAKGRGQYV